MQTITPFLTFNHDLQEVMDFYSSIFTDATFSNVFKVGSGNPGEKGSVMSATFNLNGQKFMAMNGGPTFSFSQGFSLFVNCKDQAEVDELWAKLSDGGKEGRCGWLEDRFGVSWQIIPKTLGELMGDQDPAKSKRVMEAMLKMNKIIVADLQSAYEGK
jgi:predicted 3-demethylubiquinone-9 3-methyltransferase (glyoxalase superfamily)